MEISFNHFLHLIPSIIAIVLLCLDSKYNLTKTVFIDHAKEKAIENISDEIINNIEMSESHNDAVVETLKNWHFKCFETASLAISQLQFLELMFCQSLIFFILWYHDEQDAIYLTIVLGAVFILLYLNTYFEHEHNTWYMSKQKGSCDGDNYIINHDKFLIRRLTTIIACMVVFTCGVSITDYLKEIIPGARFNILILILILTVVIALWTMFRIKKRWMQKTITKFFDN